ncbi:MAG TPA: 2-phosphosulfolactate phosphatase [Verrucomicrobiae bacterium]|jgi:2-phosphosulfolactate phosphatase
MKIEVILTPAELPALAKRDLSAAGCVVFDVLRATSTFVTALANGAAQIIPVSEISEALAIRKQQPGVLLGGERQGVKIRAGGIDFEFGNSPREYSPEAVRGKTIVSTTTNGTRALRACPGAKTVLAASLLNLGATANFIRNAKIEKLYIVCAGTFENAALEDILAAGALGELVLGGNDTLSDSAKVAIQAFAEAKSDLANVLCGSENARRLLSMPELRDDVAFCLQRDVFDLAVVLGSDGALRKS